MCSLGKHAAERARPRTPAEQAEDVTSHLIEPHPAGKLLFRVRHETMEHVETRGRRLGRSEQVLINLGEEIRILIGRASEHHAIDVGEMSYRFAERPDSAIHDDGKIWPTHLDAIDPIIVDRRYVAVLLRAQAFEPSLAGMQDEGAAAASRHRVDKPV